MNARTWRACAGLALSVLMLVGFGPVASARSSSAPAPGEGGASDVDKGELLGQGGSSYPRLVRVQHGGEANGRVLASTTTYVDEAGRAAIYESRDDGASFQRVGEIRDPAGEHGKGMCCSTLYELPRAVGDMPAGTLLWAGTAGVGDDEDQRRSSIRLWRSDDHGRSWSFVSNIASPPTGAGVWEPEFTVSRGGDLVAFWSDDMDPRHDQKIVQARSRNGRDWSEARDTVKHDRFEVRPGMPGVRQLPDGTYVMVYEVCNLDPDHVCTVRTRTSQDGWNFGDPEDLGTEVVSESGTQPLGTPTISVAPGPGPNGRLLLGYQMLGGDHGGLAPGNGRTLLVDDDPSDLGNGWREIPSPVRIDHNQGGTCRNFSPALLPAQGGASVIHMTTDYEKYIGGPCEAYFGTGPSDANAAVEQPQPARGPQPVDDRPGR